MKSFILLASLSILPAAVTQAATTVNADKKVTRTIPVPAKDPWDFDVHGGAVMGGKFTLKNGIVKNFAGSIAGLSLYNENIVENQTLLLNIDFLIDQGTNQVIRKGFGFGSNYALLGGKKRTIERTKPGIIVNQNAYSLTWNNRLSYDSFSVSSPALGVEALEGSNVSLLTGVGFNIFITTQTSIAVSLMQTAISFSASIEKSTQSSTEFGLAFRSYL